MEERRASARHFVGRGAPRWRGFEGVFVRNRATPLPPPFCVSAHAKGLTAPIFVTAHSKGVTAGQLRPKPGKTRCLLGTAHPKGLKRVNSRQLTADS